jgi:hypothetical protein
MGTAAENEKRKLSATFWNNLAAALVIAGFVGPYVAFVKKTSDAGAASGSIFDLFKMTFILNTIFEGLQLFGLAGLMFLLAYQLRRYANAHLDQIDDG